MVARQNFKWVVCALVLLLGCSMARAQVAPPEPEKQKIEALINRVSDLKGAKFIRNGREYDVNTAVRFLRGKWKANDEEVRTARDFVDKVASISGTSGEPYHIRFQDGRETTSRNFLLAELRELES